MSSEAVGTRMKARHVTRQIVWFIEFACAHWVGRDFGGDYKFWCDVGSGKPRALYWLQVSV